MSVADGEVGGFLPYHEALSRMKGADVLLLVVGEGHQRLVPAKLFDYLAARRFVLALGPAGSEAGAIVRETGVGQVVERSDVEAIAGAIAARFGAPREDLPNSPAISRYEARATMIELDRLLREVVACR